MWPAIDFLSSFAIHPASTSGDIEHRGEHFIPGTDNAPWFPRDRFQAPSRDIRGSILKNATSRGPMRGLGKSGASPAPSPPVSPPARRAGISRRRGSRWTPDHLGCAMHLPAGEPFPEPCSTRSDALSTVMPMPTEPGPLHRGNQRVIEVSGDSVPGSGAAPPLFRPRDAFADGHGMVIGRVEHTVHELDVPLPQTQAAPPRPATLAGSESRYVLPSIFRYVQYTLELAPQLGLKRRRGHVGPVRGNIHPPAVVGSGAVARES